MAQRIVAIVQARMGSARLPGKSLMPLAGKALIEHVLERVRAIDGLDDIALATSVNSRDGLLAEVAEGCGVTAFRGDEADVLGRYVDVADALGADSVMRITGDCPFLAPEVCARVLATHLAEPWWDYVSNDTLRSGYPDGLDCEIFTTVSLHRAHVNALARQDREHVTPWMRRSRPTYTVMAPRHYGHVKLSVDDASDLAFARRVYGYLPPGQFDLAATLAAVACATQELEGV